MNFFSCFRDQSINTRIVGKQGTVVGHLGVGLDGTSSSELEISIMSVIHTLEQLASDAVSVVNGSTVARVNEFVRGQPVKDGRGGSKRVDASRVHHVGA